MLEFTAGVFRRVHAPSQIKIVVTRNVRSVRLKFQRNETVNRFNFSFEKTFDVDVVEFFLIQEQDPLEYHKQLGELFDTINFNAL